jgi:hypothetical protein
LKLAQGRQWLTKLLLYLAFFFFFFLLWGRRNPAYAPQPF